MVRIWVDGCFDTMHYGHANALRQAKLMGDYLIVGVHSDAEILKHKGPTVIKEQDRYAAVRACKWVDEVVENAPYTTEVEYLDRYYCDFCVHGDDVTTTSDGSDCYALVKKANRYKECKRTGGVSTSDLVSRMLYRKEHPEGRNYSDDYNAFNETSKGITKTETVLDTIKIFSEGSKELTSSDKIIKISGSFDMFHAKHSAYFESIKKDSNNNYLIVGIQSDEFVFKTTGQYPILNMYERALCVLSCRYCDKVILDCEESNEFIETPALLKETKMILERILQNYDAYQARNNRKKA